MTNKKMISERKMTLGHWSFFIGHSILFDQIFFEHHQIIRVRAVPADADNIEAEFDSEVDEFTLVIHALTADVFVAVIARPGDLGVVQLPGDSAATGVGFDGAHPVIKHARLEFEAHPEADGPVVHAGDQRQHVVAAEKASLEKIDLSPGPKNGIVNLNGLGEQLFVSDDDIGLGHVVDFSERNGFLSAS